MTKQELKKHFNKAHINDRIPSRQWAYLNDYLWIEHNPYKAMTTRNIYLGFEHTYGNHIRNEKAQAVFLFHDGYVKILVKTSRKGVYRLDTYTEEEKFAYSIYITGNPKNVFDRVYHLARANEGFLIVH